MGSSARAAATEFTATGATTTAPHVDDAVVVAYLGDDGSGWLPSLLSLRRAHGDVAPFVAGSQSCDGLGRVSVDVTVESLSDLLRRIAAEHDAAWIVVVGEPCVVPADHLHALRTLTDERIATVSFLSNSAGPLSFPFAGTPVPWVLGGGTPDALTAALRAYEPAPAAPPVPIAAGPVVAFSSSVVRMLPPGWDHCSNGWEESIAGFSLAAQARGLLNVVDTTTFVHRPGDLRPLRQLSAESLARLRRRHPWVDRGISLAITDETSPFRLEHRIARSKVQGLDLLLDGSCLGPLEMGTQVGLLAICQALAQRDDVASIAVTLHGTLPPYARSLAQEPKVSFLRILPSGRLEIARRYDLAFRPYQPDVSFEPTALSAHADRLVVSLLDLIAYQNGSYFASGEAWADYRKAVVTTLRAADGVTTISNDVATMVGLERLPIALDRLFPIPYGTEHVTEDAPKRMPEAFAAAAHAQFLLCLGTNYGHKNRDLAIRTLGVLRDRGHDISLVLAGPAVPYGTSRLHEAEAVSDLATEPIVWLADVTAEERNWLLAHAVAVLYPTSAEGFGLVPYEAAWLGTPTVFVPFGPLAEMAGDLPVTAHDWSPDSFADAVELQLRDPQLGEDQVRRLKEASKRWSWSATAALLTHAFRVILAKPPAADPYARSARSHDHSNETET